MLVCLQQKRKIHIEVESESGFTEHGGKNVMKLRMQAIVM